MSTAVLCIAKSEGQAERIYHDLVNAGFNNDDISIIFPEPHKAGVGHTKASKSPEGAAVGASTGGVLGGIVGLLAGMGTLAIPGLGPFIAAGPILAALGGLGAGATVGGLTGAIVGLGIPEYEAKVYEDRLRKGNILLSVHTMDSNEKARAQDVMKTAGAEDISSVSEASVPRR